MSHFAQQVITSRPGSGLVASSWCCGSRGKGLVVERGTTVTSCRA